jgi:general secretion pathway protein C
VTIGKEFRPGARVKEIGLSYAIIATQAGDLRMQLGRAGSTAIAGSAATGAGAGDAGTSPASTYRNTVDYRHGLQPMRSNGRISGFALKPNAALPQLQEAGLQPGDILVSVNGQAFESEEKVLELSNEIATSRTAQFEFLRNGKKMAASLVVQ